MKPARNLAAQKIGLWSVLSRHPENYKRTFVQWLCRCECGTERVVLANSLLMGKSHNCGCSRRLWLAARNFKHGASLRGQETATYRIWKHMVQRCTNSRSKDFRYYGARGIRVCDRWQNSFENFLADMGERPAGLTIDRINNDGNYEPSNCRWATMAQQNTNKRRDAWGDEVGKYTAGSEQ